MRLKTHINREQPMALIQVGIKYTGKVYEIHRTGNMNSNWTCDDNEHGHSIC